MSFMSGFICLYTHIGCQIPDAEVQVEHPSTICNFDSSLDFLAINGTVQLDDTNSKLKTGD